MKRFNQKTMGPIMLSTVISSLMIVVFLFVWLFLGASSAGASDPGEDVVGPGLPPSEMLAEWYLPDSMQGDDADYLSLFPDLSPYAACGNYTRHTMMCTWYFEDQDAFLHAETNLSRYLAGSGEVDIVELDLTGVNITDEISGPRVFNATRYQNETTSGYFLIFSKPFFDRNDCYIVYYGTRDNGTLQDPELEKMMARSLARAYGFGRGVVEIKNLNMTSGDTSPNTPGFELLGGLLALCWAGLYGCKRLRLT
jgi:hypothetical protein